MSNDIVVIDEIETEDAQFVTDALIISFATGSSSSSCSSTIIVY